MIFGLFDECVDDLGPLSVRNPVLLHLKFKQKQKYNIHSKEQNVRLVISLWKIYLFALLQPDHTKRMSSNCQDIVFETEKIVSFIESTIKGLSEKLKEYQERIQYLKNCKRVKIEEDEPSKKIVLDKTAESSAQKTPTSIKEEPSSLNFDIELTDLDFLTFEPTLMQTNSNEIAISREEEKSLWQEFRQVERAKIQKANPLDPLKLIDSFIEQRWNTLSQEEREAQIKKERKQRLENAKKLKKKEMEEYNAKAKISFERLLSKKPKRDTVREKQEAKEEVKVNVADLRAELEKRRAARQHQTTFDAKNMHSFL